MSGQFYFESTNELGKVCNAPKNGIGVYLVYTLKKDKFELIYIGSSGKVRQNGTSKLRKGGIYDRIVNGKQFGDVRRKTWKQKMIDKRIDTLRIQWYVTFDQHAKNIPVVVEGNLIQEYFNTNGKLPEWNMEF